MSRAECRALLSRLGEKVKCICLGDIHQVDNPHLNQENDGLNWIVRKFKGSNAGSIRRSIPGIIKIAWLSNKNLTQSSQFVNKDALV